jgi:hypothetical protein
MNFFSEETIKEKNYEKLFYFLFKNFKSSVSV